MRFPNRAGGFAAAMLLPLLGTFNPTPSRAGGMNLPAVTAPAPAPAATEAAPIQVTAPAPAPAEAQPALQPMTDDSPPRSLAATVADNEGAAAADAEQQCLATAVYFEAKGEPLRGQLAVAQVILNRTHSGRFPSSVCGVVRQRGQFSFVHGGRLPSVPRASAAWRKAVAVARTAREGAEPVAAKALFFHARSVSTGWHAVRVAQIGNHVFYR
jgi:spore germination cell wall hydrolase CwlJ-like protein